MCSNTPDLCKDTISVLIFKLYESRLFVVSSKKVKICKWKTTLNCVTRIYYTSSNYAETLSYFTKNHYTFEELEILWKWGALLPEDDGTESLSGATSYIHPTMIIHPSVCRERVITMKQVPRVHMLACPNAFKNIVMMFPYFHWLFLKVQTKAIWS